MQTHFKSLADIKKRTPTVEELQNAADGEFKNIQRKFLIADEWIYKIFIVGLCAIMLKTMIYAFI
jgi:hypothetical protein